MQILVLALLGKWVDTFIAIMEVSEESIGA